MYIMSKDIVVAEFDFNSMYWNVYRQDLMPLALRGDNINILNIQSWLMRRVVSTSRLNAKQLLNALNLSQTDKVKVCIACKGLSLTDCYWLKEKGSNDTWGKVNLYRNKFSEALANIALTGSSHGKAFTIQGRLHTPDIADNGSYAKCWRRYNGGFIYIRLGHGKGRSTGKY